MSLIDHIPKTDDIKYMQRAVELALSGLGHVSPNPVVGAVVVSQDKIIGQGHHECYGGPHAEVIALNNISTNYSTLYVTLEPCNHQGTTPPCTDKIIEKNIGRVVVGSIDPDPKMKGKSIKLLTELGIKVDVGIMKNATDELIQWYSHWNQTGLPYVTCKLAVTGNNYYAQLDGTSRWISSDISRAEVHQLRAEYDAVLVGTNTVIMDDPLLTVRIVTGRNPNRIVLDRFGRIPVEANIFNQDNLQVFYFSTQRNKYLGTHVKQIIIPEDNFSLYRVLKYLGQLKQTSLLVEGGGQLVRTLIDQNLCQEVILYKAGNLFQHGLPFDTSMLKHNNFSLVHQTESGSDKKYIYRRKNV